MQFSWVEESVFVLVPTGDLSSQSSDTLMSLRTTPIPRMVSAGSAGVRYPAGSLGRAGVQCVRPVPSELGRGRAVACLVCCLVIGCFACGAGRAVAV